MLAVPLSEQSLLGTDPGAVNWGVPWDTMRALLIRQ